MDLVKPMETLIYVVLFKNIVLLCWTTVVPRNLLQTVHWKSIRFRTRRLGRLLACAKFRTLFCLIWAINLWTGREAHCLVPPWPYYVLIAFSATARQNTGTTTTTTNCLGFFAHGPSTPLSTAPDLPGTVFVVGKNGCDRWPPSIPDN